MNKLKLINPYQYTTVSLKVWTYIFILRNPFDSFSWFWDELENDW